MNPWIKRIGLALAGIYVIGVVYNWRNFAKAGVANAAALAFRWPIINRNPDRYQGTYE